MKLRLVALAKLYIALAFTLGMLAKYFPSPVFSVIDDLLFIAAVLSAFLVKRGVRLDKPVPLSWIIPAVVIIGCVISFANENNVVAMVLMLRQYKNFFLCFLFFFLGEEARKFLLKTILVVLIASVPLSIYQFMTVEHWDEITGFLGYGASGTLALLIVFYVASQFLIRVNERRSVVGLYWLLLIPVFLNETKITFLLLPLIVVTGLVAARRLGVGKAIGLGLVGFVMSGLVNGLYETLYGVPYFSFLSGEHFDRYMYGSEIGTDIGRFARIILSVNYISNQGLLALLFGEGTGASFLGESSGVQGVAAQAFTGTGLNHGSRVQMFHFLIDFGLVGSALFTGVVITVFLALIKTRLKCRDDIYLFCISSVVIAGLIYQPVFFGRELSLIYSIFLYRQLNSRGLERNANTNGLPEPVWTSRRRNIPL